MEEHDDEMHEYTRTGSLPDSVLKLVKVSVRVVPGEDDMVT